MPDLSASEFAQLTNEISMIIVGADTDDFVPLTTRYQIADAVVRAGWRPGATA